MQSSVGEHLDCFQYGVKLRLQVKLLRTFMYQSLYGHLSPTLNKWIAVKWLDNVACVCSAFKETAALFAKVVGHITFLPVVVYESCNSSKSLAILCIVSFFKFSHSHKCVVKSIIALFYISQWLIVLSIFFMYIFTIYLSSLVKCLQIFCSIIIGLYVYLLLNWKSYLFILYKNPLLYTYWQIVSLGLKFVLLIINTVY